MANRTIYKKPVSRHIKMDKEISDKLEAMAVEQSRSVTWLVNEAIKEYLRK